MIPSSRAALRLLAAIVAAATRLFHEKGYESTSIQDVAEAVGILKGSLYYYIQTKEDLLYALALDGHTKGVATLEEERSWLRTISTFRPLMPSRLSPSRPSLSAEPSPLSSRGQSTTSWSMALLPSPIRLL